MKVDAARRKSAELPRVVPSAVILVGVDSFIFELVTEAYVEAQLVIDDVSLTRSAIPEPSSFVLAVLGLLGLGAFVARRRA